MMLKPTPSKNQPSLESHYFLFEELPCFSSKERIYIFNFQKGLMGDFPFKGGSSLNQYSSDLRDSGLFDIEFGLSPGQLTGELDIVLNATDHCNMRCIYCFLDNPNSRTPFLDSSMAIDFIARSIELSGLDEFFVTFFGGEPTLNPKLIMKVTDYVRNIRQKIENKRIHLAITTNGCMSDQILDYCIKNDYQFTISMDGVPEVQEFQRPLKDGTSSLKIIEYNIKRIAQSNNALRIRLTVTDKSVSFMNDSLHYLSKLGAKLIHFESVNIAGRAAKSQAGVQRPSVHNFINNLFECIDTARDIGASILSTSVAKIAFPSRFMCEGASGNRIAISPSGFISRCLEVQQETHPLSYLMGIQNYVPLNKGGHHSHDTNEHFIRQAWPQDCLQCFCKWVCSNGCPSRNFHMTGDPFRVDPFYCNATKSIVAKFLNRVCDETTTRGIFRQKGAGALWYMVHPSEFYVIPSGKRVFVPIITSQIL